MAISRQIASSSSWEARFYKWWVAPRKTFQLTPPPAAPDYSDHGSRSWAAFPGRGDGRTNPAELAPQGETLLPEEERPVDCFYINPTTYGIFTGGRYNAPLDDSVANVGIDVCLGTQASSFNGQCRIYAPRYRQVGLGISGEDRVKASELAFQDCKDAFEHYIKNINPGGRRPLIIAGHSQGTRMAVRLIKECVEGTPLADRLIAAYLIGGWVSASELKTIQPSQGSTHTGCVIGWDTVNPSFAARLKSGGTSTAVNRSLVTNPLTWVTSTGDGERDKKQDLNQQQHLGVLLAEWGWYRPSGAWMPRYGVRSLGRPVMLQNWNVENEGNFLVVDRPELPKGMRSRAYASPIWNGSYHIVDYALFYYNIRANVEDRVKAFLLKEREKGPRL